jgi:class 3 adenylate cyclase
MMVWPRSWGAGGILASAVGVNLDEGPGLVATQTLMFVFADIEGSAAMAQRLGDAYAGVLAGHHHVIRAGLAAHAG